MTTLTPFAGMIPTNTKPFPNFLCPSALLYTVTHVKDPKEILPMKVINDFWLYFRNYDPEGSIFGNPPPLGDMGHKELIQTYVDEYAGEIRPIFYQFVHQLVFVPNDRSDIIFSIVKLGNSFTRIQLDMRSNEYQQTVRDLLFYGENNKGYFGRMITVLYYSC